MPIPADPVNHFEIYEYTPLPSGARPLLIVSWEIFVEPDENELRRLQYFIIVPREEVRTHEIHVPQGDLIGAGIAEAFPIESMKEFALRHAQRQFDLLVLSQLESSRHAHPFRPIEKRKVDEIEFSGVAISDEYNYAWSFIRDRTYAPKLFKQMKQFIKLHQLGFEFVPAPLARRR